MNTEDRSAVVLHHPAFDRPAVQQAPKRPGRRPKSVINIRTAALGMRIAQDEQAKAARANRVSPYLSTYQALSTQDRLTLEAARAILQSQMMDRGAPINGLSGALDLVRLHLAFHDDRERFGVMLFDASLRLIRWEELFLGTIAQCGVYPREVARCALAHNAQAVILAHNHPSGCVQPSKADIELTTTLKASLELVGVRVLDHLIVGGNGHFSFAEAGML